MSAVAGVDEAVVLPDWLSQLVFEGEDAVEFSDDYGNDYAVNQKLELGRHVDCGRVQRLTEWDPDLPSAELVPSVCLECYNDRCLICNGPFWSDEESGTVCGSCMTAAVNRD